MERRFLKADLHVHSSHSFDSRADVKDILIQAKQRGLDIVGVTDHGTRKGGLEAQQRARGIRVLVGQEVKTRQGDLLVFNVDQDLTQAEDLVVTCKRARELGGFIIIPHPFDPLRQGTGKETAKVAKYADAVEAFNPKCFFDWSNRKAEAFAQEHRLPMVAGSDAHAAAEVGRAYSLIEGRDVFEAIRGGRVSMVRGKVAKAGLLKKRVERVFGKR